MVEKKSEIDLSPAEIRLRKMQRSLPKPDIETGIDVNFIPRLKEKLGESISKSLEEMSPYELSLLQTHADQTIDALRRQNARLKTELDKERSKAERAEQQVKFALQGKQQMEQAAREITFLAAAYRKWVKTIPHKSWCAGAPPIEDLKGKERAKSFMETGVCTCGRNFLLSGDAGKEFETYVFALEVAVEAAKEVHNTRKQLKSLNKAELNLWKSFDHETKKLNDAEVSLQKPLHPRERGFMSTHLSRENVDVGRRLQARSVPRQSAGSSFHWYKGSEQLNILRSAEEKKGHAVTVKPEQAEDDVHKRLSPEAKEKHAAHFEKAHGKKKSS